MSHTRARTFDAWDFVRSLPALLGALLAVVFAVDIVLAYHPTWIDELSRTVHAFISVRTVAVPSAQILPAALAVGCVVLASAVLLAFAHAAARAPQLAIPPVWVSLCLLAVWRVQEALPWPVSTPLFLAASALVFVAASVALGSGSRIGNVVGWMLLGLPFAVLGTGYRDAARNPGALSEGLVMLVSALGASALGVVLLSFLRKRSSRDDVPGLEGVDVVEELFLQVERAERAEARVAELERQLHGQARQRTGEQRAVRRVR